MSFIAKNPLILPEIKHTPSTPPGTRGIFAAKDGLYEVDSNNNVTLISKNGGGSGNVDLSNYYTKDETTQLVDSKISTVYKYCGTVDSVGELPEGSNISSQNIGYTYNVINGTGELPQFKIYFINWIGTITQTGDGKTAYLKVSDGEKDITTFLLKDMDLFYDIDGSSNVITLKTFDKNGWIVDWTKNNTETLNIFQYNTSIKCSDGDNVAWTGYYWDVLSGTVTIDLSDYYTKDEVNNSLTSKQDVANMYSGFLDDGIINVLGEEKYPNVKALKQYVNDKISENSGDADLSSCEKIANKLTLDEYQKASNKGTLLTDERYLSALLAYVMHKGLVNDITTVQNESEHIFNKIITDDESYSNARYYSANATDEKLSTKEDKTTFIYLDTSESHIVSFSQMYKSEIRIQNVPAISLEFYDGEYEPDYISGLSFDSGETPTRFDYTSSGIINWVGTDCTKDGDLSIFQPSANTHYDIIFYFNGAQFIGLVNGFVPATGNG